MTYQFERFFDTLRVSSFTPVPNSDLILYISDASGQFNLWRTNMAGTNHEQLTCFTEERIYELTVPARGNLAAFAASPGGNELHQIYLINPLTGEHWPVTNRPTVRHYLGEFASDGTQLSYARNDPGRQATDIFVLDVATSAERAVYAAGGFFAPGPFSPTDDRLIGLEFIANTHQNLWLIEAGGSYRQLAPNSPAIRRPLTWKKDGSGFYFLTNEGREFQGLAFYNLAAESWAYVVTGDWDVETVALAPNDERIAYVLNEAGGSVLYTMETHTNAASQFRHLPRGVIANLRFAPNESDRLLALISTYRQNRDIISIHLRTDAVAALTESMKGGIPAEVFVEPELVVIESFDGLKIHAWLYRPHGTKPGERVPAVLSIHGGPEEQERPNYVYGGLYQYMLSQGVAVLAPNIRGSTGFGIDHQRRILRDFGGDDLKDIEACAQYLRSLPWVNAERLAVWGGSYGGFATLSAATRLPQYWACAVDVCGPSNLVTMAKSVPPEWRPLMKAWMGDPDEDREMLLARSPITYVDQIRCPLMILQGANDPRVVQAESDQIVERLRSLGREVEYIVFPDEGHGFAKRPNQLRAFQAMTDFLLRHLT